MKVEIEIDSGCVEFSASSSLHLSNNQQGIKIRCEYSLLMKGNEQIRAEKIRYDKENFGTRILHR